MDIGHQTVQGSNHWERINDKGLGFRIHENSSQVIESDSLTKTLKRCEIKACNDAKHHYPQRKCKLKPQWDTQHSYYNNQN